MKKEIFKITKMDCPSEEQLIRMKLEPLEEVQNLQFDIPNRKLTVFHIGDTSKIKENVSELNLNSTLVSSEISKERFDKDEHIGDKKLLWIVFAINAGFFVVEIIAGYFAHSMGLVADSLDMLADAIVYGMSLMVVGAALSKKKRVAKLSGIFQLGLAIFGIVEVIRRFFGFDGAPDYITMVLISIFALIGNAASLYMLQKKKSTEAHMEASYIFTSNDVIANIGVIMAGIIIYFTQSILPDLVIGTIVFGLVARGAFRIMKLAK